jgi:hypothetical protein
MQLIARIVDRALAALLMATSVVLLSAGLFSYAPVVTGVNASPSPTEVGDPNFPTPTGPLETTPVPPSGSPAITLSPSPSTSPSGSPSSSPSTSPSLPTTTPGGGTPPPPINGRALATRIVIPSLNIDLPIVAADLVVPGNRNFYPLCDVAQYLMEYSQPGEPGTTYLYAHARTGMFLPLLEQSQRNNGRSMLGALVEVYTSDNRLHLYEIYIVKRHATDLSLAYELPPEGHHLIMQTSEGPRGTVPKLQVAARPLSVVPADPRDANPVAHPRACR